MIHKIIINKDDSSEMVGQTNINTCKCKNLLSRIKKIFEFAANINQSGFSLLQYQRIIGWYFAKEERNWFRKLKLLFIEAIDILLLGCCTGFSYTLIKWCSQLAKIIIPHPPPLPHPLTFNWMNELANKWGLS